MACCGEVEKDPEEDIKANKEDLGCGDDGGDPQYGPAPNRGCTDAWCLIVLLVAWGAYIVVTIAGIADGNPAKLTQPRDYQGAYCDVETNWNNGPNLKGFPKLSYTMNATSSTDLIVKQMMCSSAVEQALTQGYSGGPGPILQSQFEREDYLCECCKIPCGKCSGSLQVGGDIASPGGIQSVIGDKLADLRGLTNPANLFDPSGSNGDVFSDMWSEATKYFNQVCLTDCTSDFDTVSGNADARTWQYNMSADNGLKPFYDAIRSNGPQAIKDTIDTSFTFQALPLELCPYPASKCIPMPGLEFEELVEGSGYCTFKMGAEVVTALGDAAASAFVGLGGEAFADSMGETFGKWVGDFVRSIDTFICVCVCAFAVGFIYMVLLRLLVGCCVWMAVFMVFVVLLLGGGLCYARSYQCQGSGLFETGQQMIVAVGSTAAVAATNAVTQQEPRSEELTGDGANYTGAQAWSKLGNKCINWGETGTEAASYTLVNYPGTGIEGSYCRNPYREDQRYKAKTIWCFTSNPEVTWEECTPVGVIQPICDHGYDIASAELRKVLEISSYVLWGLAGLYFFLVICLTNRIRLAIAVNKVASVFVGHTPMILLLPAIQTVIAAVWALIWAYSAAFLLSQVPDDYVPKGAFSTYAEAYGTDTVPGKCNAEWPTGSVWKDDDNCEIINGTAACWKCAPPRYAFDYRFAVSFFVFLWNNALNVAVGQCIIAGAVAVWFFTVNRRKGSKSAIRKSTWNVFRYHLGSLALGSFIIAVIQFIRYLMKYYEQQAKAQKNRVMVIILKVGQCCIWCLEKCVKFLNKNAYIQIALMGTNFCTSAKKAFFLILRNALRFGTVAILGSMIHIIGIAFIVAGTTVIGYFLFVAMHPDESPAVNVIIYLMTSYIIARLFTSIFELAVDSTLQCFLVCEETDMGVAGEDGFVPSSLESWLDTGKKPEDVQI